MTNRDGRFRGLLPAIAAAAVAVACGASAAESMTEVIVEVPKISHTGGRSQPLGAPVELALIRYRVSYADLNLATRAGAKTLEERINDAAQRACKDVEAHMAPNDISLPDDPPCVKTAVDGAMRQAREAIAAAARRPSR